jgi:iron complex outermembrane receptor protein/vitamin B12 transporter
LRNPFARPLLLAFFALAHLACWAGEIHGIVTDPSGAPIAGATIALLNKKTIVASAVSGGDGSFQVITGVSGRFYLLVTGKTFRQLETPGFYAGRLDNLERNLVLEPAWVRESIVVTATGTPTPQAQTSAATSVLGPTDIELRDDLVSALRLMPGTAVAQVGQRGAQASLFIRGGDSDANKILVDGVSAGDLGGRFDFGPLSTTAIERAEIYRGPDSNLYGADAASGVVSLTTPRGTTSFPSFLFHGDAGNFLTSQEDLEAAGTHNKLDYLGEFSWLQTNNNLPNDEFHVATAAANLGWQPNGTTQIRGTLHYGVDATGVPNAWQFYQIADDATQKDQDLFISASIDNQATADFHNTVRYGATRKREQYYLWQPTGELLTYDDYGDQAYYGNSVTITGANGYAVSGQAQLDYPETYPYQQYLDSNRDELVYQGDYRFTPHLTGLIGFRFEDERGRQYIPEFLTDESTERTNYDYVAAVHGDFKNRIFYMLGGNLEHYSEFGTQTSPRAGLSGYVLRPRNGIFSGTRILFNFGEAVREPALTDEFDSLYRFLVSNGYQSDAQQLHISPLAAPEARTYEGGGEQGFLSNRIILRASYFHNEFGKEIEGVGGKVLLNIIPGLTPAELGYYYSDDYPLSVNTEAFRAQGVETTVEGGIGRSIFLRGGYTYLDAVVQRSFDSDNEALTGGYAPTLNGIPIGAISPLVGARPFRRPPHTGFFTATYSAHKLTGVFTSAFSSRSDDSTYLEYADTSGENSLLLPNRNLDYGFAKVDLGASYQLLSWLGVYGQAENLTNNEHIAPIGYVSLPVNVRLGLRLQWGKGSGQ